MGSQGPYLWALWVPRVPGLMDPGLMDPGLMDPGLMDPGLMDPGLMDPGLMDPGLMDPGLMARNRRLPRDFHTRPKIGFFYRKTENFYRKNDQEKISEIFVQVAPEKT